MPAGVRTVPQPEQHLGLLATDSRSRGWLLAGCEARREERRLEETSGAAFVAYARRVPRHG
jgi:hypothetical protein